MCLSWEKRVKHCSLIVGKCNTKSFYFDASSEMQNTNFSYTQYYLFSIDHTISSLSHSRRKSDGSFITKSVPFPPTEKTLFLVTDTRVKHNLGASEYPKRKRMCQSAAEKLGRTSLREATMEEVEGEYLLSFYDTKIIAI